MQRVIIILAVFLIGLSPISLNAQNKNFISFSVSPATGQVVIIQWKIASSSDILRFEVERSIDTIKWESISQVVIQSTQEYFITDTSPGSGQIYYRIKQINNGNTSYSPTRWVQISKTGTLYIWPNPAKDILHIKTPFVNGSLEIINAEGKLIQKIAITDFITDISLQRLAEGIYFIRVKHGKEILVEKFVKGR